MQKKFTAKTLSILLLAIVTGFALIFIVQTFVSQPQPGTPYKTLPKLRADLTSGSINFAKKPIVDLSAYQPHSVVDNDLLANDVSGAVVRVQDGIKAKASNTVNADGSDPAFKYHITELQARGIPVAVYAFANATSVENMKAEARAFYQRAKTFQPTFWWVDVETSSMKDMNAGVEAFRAELESLGVANIGIYSRDNFLTENKIDSSKFAAAWLAFYGAKNDGSFTKLDTTRVFQMQQYTDQGKMSGYPDNVDLSRPISQTAYEKLFLGKQKQ